MVGIITQKGITVRQGDSFSIRLCFKDEKGYKNISGAIISMQVRNIDGSLLFTKIADIEDETSGYATINLTPKETTIDVGEYFTDIEIKDAQGFVHTIYPQNINNVAFFKITAQVTE